jgi:simple sugar transport system ATP-binding protein
LLVAEQPTQGLDVSATEAVWQRLLEARKIAGVLLVTGDLAEALQLADRVAVMFRGRVMGQFPVSDRAQVERIGSLMAGLIT